MATLATHFRQSEAIRMDAETNEFASRTRAQAHPCALRALPNDDIYLYHKRVDNSRVVRQADPAARGACWSAVGAAALILVLGGSVIAPHVGTVLAGYKLEALKQERQNLIDQKRELEVREAALLSPERLIDLAKAQHLTSPASSQLIDLGVDTQAPAVARAQQPQTPQASQ